MEAQTKCFSLSFQAADCKTRILVQENYSPEKPEGNGRRGKGKKPSQSFWRVAAALVLQGNYGV